MGWLNYLGAAGGLANLGMSLYGTHQGIKQGRQQNKIAQQQADLMAQRDAERRAIYGDLEKNMADYYNKLTPAQRTAQGLDRYDKQFKMAQDKIAQNYAQKGLTGSGIEAETNYQMEQQAILDRLQLAQDAETSTNQEKLGWLGYGSGQANLAQQAMANANAQRLQSLANQQNNWMNLAQQSGQSAGDIFGALMYQRARNGSSSLF